MCRTTDGQQIFWICRLCHVQAYIGTSTQTHTGTITNTHIYIHSYLYIKKVVWKKCTHARTHSHIHILTHKHLAACVEIFFSKTTLTKEIGFSSFLIDSKWEITAATMFPFRSVSFHVLLFSSLSMFRIHNIEFIIFLGFFFFICSKLCNAQRISHYFSDIFSFFLIFIYLILHISYVHFLNVE